MSNVRPHWYARSSLDWSRIFEQLSCAIEPGTTIAHGTMKDREKHLPNNKLTHTSLQGQPMN
eukprot:12823173-Heterocapsa_arctica.AAC.1